MKKIIFFDGDGTLWQPDTEKYHEPWAVYADKDADAFKEMQAVPNVIEALESIGALGTKRVLLSTSPLPKELAITHRQKMVKSVGLEGLLDEIYVTEDRPEAKGEMMTNILKAKNLHKKDALMAGDMYKWDYRPAQDVGIDALLLCRPYSFKHFENINPLNVKKIDSINDILQYIS